jgi:hypothetical protein
MDLFPLEFVPELNTKNLGSSPSFLTIIHMTLSLNNLEFTEFRLSTSLLNSVSGQNSGGTDLQFSVSDSQNFASPKYCFRRQLSQLSDGPSDSSKWLAICELRQSETRPVAESAFQADYTFLYKTGFWRNFAMTSPETSYMKNITSELSFWLVTLMAHFDIWFGCYGFLKSGYGAELILDSLM